MQSTNVMGEVSWNKTAFYFQNDIGNKVLVRLFVFSNKDVYVHFKPMLCVYCILCVLNIFSQAPSLSCHYCLYTHNTVLVLC